MYPEKRLKSFGIFVARLNRALQEIGGVHMTVARRADAARGILSYAQLAYRALQYQNFDIVHVHFMGAAAWVGMATHPKTPLLITAHGSDISTARTWHSRAMLKCIAYRAAGLHFVSNDLRHQAELLGMRLPTQTTLVRPIGIDLSRFIPVPNHKSLMPSRTTHIAMVGNPVSYKGWSEAVHAIQRLRQLGTNVRLLAVGPGAHHRYAHEARALGVDAHIEWMGNCDEETVLHTLHRSDILWAPSYREGFGLAPLEGMACGLAVIATGVDGMAEYMTHEENALIIPTRCPESLATATLRLTQDTDLLKRLRVAGPQTAARFDIVETATQIHDLYRRLFQQTHQ